MLQIVEQFALRNFPVAERDYIQAFGPDVWRGAVMHPFQDSDDPEVQDLNPEDPSDAASPAPKLQPSPAPAQSGAPAQPAPTTSATQIQRGSPAERPGRFRENHPQ